MWKLWFLSLIFAAPVLGKDVSSEHMFVQKRTDKIYHRYYLIKRLRPSLALLNHENIRRLIAFEELDSALFRQPQMQAMVEQIAKDKTLYSLFELWDQFIAYQHLYSTIFVNEFIELVHYLYDLMRPQEHNRVAFSLPIEHRLDVIDRYVREVCDNIKYSKKSTNRELDEVTTDSVAKRFFIIKRLQKSIQFLHYLQKNIKRPFKQKDVQRVFDDETGLLSEIEHFSHGRVRECIEQMCKRKDLEPLLHVCKEFKQYRFAQDDTFLQEMLMNIFLVYKSLLFKDLSAQTEQVVMIEMNQVLELYENLESLPLDETLEAIDVVTDKLIAIQALESQKKTSYLRWIIPGIVCVCAGFGAHFFMN